MTYKVMPVSNSRQMKDFLMLPFVIYRHDPNWVPPITSEVRRIINEKINPYFNNAQIKFFVCYKNNTAVSRTAIIINRLHHEKFGVNAVFFGFFESINDPDAVRYLFDEAESYCKSQGSALLEGPFNPNHYSELGLQVNKFGTPPTFFQPYNPEYYTDLLEATGFHVSSRFHSWKNENIREYILDHYGIQTALEVDGYTVRSFSMKNIRAELEIIREVNNNAFSSNWHFLPLSREEYLFSSKFLSLITYPELIKIVEHNGSPAGVLICVLDINPLLKKMNGKVGPIKYIRFLYERRKIRKLIIYSVGIKKEYQHTPVFQLIFNAFCQIILNYNVLETTWLSEENIPAVKATDRLGLKPDKQFVIYEKYLDG
ncbi:MAG: hypothetical protein AB1410_08880 [Acidobacteriota bacterium]